MANKIRINTTTLGSDASQVHTSVNQMKEILKSLISQKAKIDAMWDGPASNQFKSAWTKDLNNLNALITEISEELLKYENNAKEKYETCNNKAKSIVDSIKV